MTFKTDIPEVPSLAEASIIANIFDEIGFYDDASLMDEFVKIASQNKDIVKQAGLWSGIWNRFSGLAKRLFFKEYRQLYAKAREAQEQIKTRMKETENMFKEATKAFKNYELVEWREIVLKLPVFTKDIMADYETAFGRLIAFTHKLQEKENIPSEKFDISDITPPGEGKEVEEITERKPIEIEKPEIKQETKKYPKLSAEEGWRPKSYNITSIQINDFTGDVALAKDKFDIMRNSTQVKQVAPKGGGNVEINPDFRGKFSGNINETLGRGIWRVYSSDKDWIYLSKVKEEVEISPPEKVERMKPKMPEWVKEIRTPEDLEKFTTSPGQTAFPFYEPKEEEQITPTQVKEVGTKPITKTDEDKKTYEKMMGKLKDKIWVSYRRGKGKDRFAIVDADKIGPGMTEVVDRDLINKLYDAYFNKNIKKKQKIRVFERPEANDGVRKAEKINDFLFKK